MARTVERVGDMQTVTGAATSSQVTFTDIPAAGAVGLIVSLQDTAGNVTVAEIQSLRVKANQVARYDVQTVELRSWQERFSLSHRANATAGRILHVPLNAFWQPDADLADLVGWEPGAAMAVELTMNPGVGNDARVFLHVVKSTIEPSAYQTLIGQDPGITGPVTNRPVRFGSPGTIHSMAFDVTALNTLDLYLGGVLVHRAAGSVFGGGAAADTGDVLSNVDFLEGANNVVGDPVFVRLAQGLRADPSDSYIDYTTTAATGRYVVHSIVPLIEG